ncbi:MAG: hypothetical protein ACI92E_002459, partial [Oceanicoccus sp.]
AKAILEFSCYSESCSVSSYNFCLSGERPDTFSNVLGLWNAKKFIFRE